MNRTEYTPEQRKKNIKLALCLVVFVLLVFIGGIYKMMHANG